MRRIRAFRLIAVLLLVSALPVAADEPLRGVALVIGESDYATLTALPNPERDARAMDDLLDDLGFDVTRVLSADAEKLRDRIAEFVADAAEADVALVYYSGHGVEIGGRNYLVPVDTDLATPASAGRSLVAVDALLEDLARTVPVTILLLDACRTDSFPAGQLIELPGGDVPLAVASGGLGEMRGPVALAHAARPEEGLGVVIGFAASPGEAALDGPAGGNSPYAAALLKHLSAGGYSFGDVMTMVGEEVYLKTGARQLPWVNSSLRRVLSFGAPPAADDPDRAAIREGRRQLLLTIASAPDTMRRYVETVASNEDVPLDALYGMLNVLGVDTSGGSLDLERQLLEGARQLKDFAARTPGAVLQDVELVRLSGLAAEAQQEGAIALALEFREQATARARELSGERDRLEAQLKADRLEIAATYGEHAETAALNFDFATAAAMFGEAYDEVRRWDDDAALYYKWNEAQALKNDGDLRGLNAPLDAAIAGYTEALALAPRATRPADWAGLQNNLGNVYLALSERSGDGETLQRAIDAFHAALEISERDTAPEDWAMTQNNLGIALVDLSYRETGRDSLDAAVAAFRAALEVRTRAALPLDWATTQNNLGIALKVLGDRTRDLALTRQSVEVFRQVLEVNTRAALPLDWAMAQSNLGNALSVLGKAEPHSGALEQAVTAYEAALEEYRQDRTPLDWAMAQNNLAVAHRAIGDRDGDFGRIGTAADIYMNVLAALDRETVPQTWAMTQNNLGVALSALATGLHYPEAAEAAVAAYRAALEVYTPAANPTEWLSAQTGLANQLVTLAFMRDDDRATLEAAVAEHRVALAVVDAALNPGAAALLHQSLALALDALAAQTGDAAMLDEAIASATIGRDYYVGQGLDPDDFEGWIGDMLARRAALAP
jgi:uncharacterized caspase-like protein